MENNTNTEDLKMELSNVAQRHLEGIRKWILFFFILGLVINIIVLIPKLIALLSKPNPSTIFFFMYDIIPCIILYYMFQFSQHIKSAITNNDSETLTIAFQYMKKYFTLIGTVVIIVMVFCIISFLTMGVYFTSLFGF